MNVFATLDSNCSVHKLYFSETGKNDNIEVNEKDQNKYKDYINKYGSVVIELNQDKLSDHLVLYLNLVKADETSYEFSRRIHSFMDNLHHGLSSTYLMVEEHRKDRNEKKVLLLPKVLLTDKRNDFLKLVMKINKSAMLPLLMQLMLPILASISKIDDENKYNAFIGLMMRVSILNLLFLGIMEYKKLGVSFQDEKVQNLIRELVTETSTHVIDYKNMESFITVVNCQKSSYMMLLLIILVILFLFVRLKK